MNHHARLLVRTAVTVLEQVEMNVYGNTLASTMFIHPEPAGRRGRNRHREIAGRRWCHQDWPATCRPGPCSESGMWRMRDASDCCVDKLVVRIPANCVRFPFLRIYM